MDCSSHNQCQKDEYCSQDGYCSECQYCDEFAEPISGSCADILNCKSWDLKCKAMTKPGKDGNEVSTCQTNSEADYTTDCKKCPAGSYSNRAGSTANKCCPLGHANETKDECVDSAENDLCNDISTYAQQGGYKDACAYFENASKP